MSHPEPSESVWHERLARAAALTEPGGPFAMEPEVVRGVTVRNYVKRPASVIELFERSVERFAEREAVVGDGARLTFGELGERVAAIAGGLRESGIRPGERVAVLSANSVAWIEAFWGSILAGAVVVPLNAWWQTDELSFAIEHSGASLVFVDEQRRSRLADTVHESRLVSIDGDGGGLRNLDDLRRARPATGRAREGDPMAIFYTSGTTGRPKGAVVDHRGVLVNLRNLVYLVVRSRIMAGEPRRREAPNVALLAVPLFHVTGCQATLIANLAAGNKLVLYPQRAFDAEAAMKLIERERVTSFAAVPTLMLRVLDSPALGDHDLSSLRSVTYGGAPVPPDLPARTRRALPGLRTVGNGYGLTETNAVVVANWGAEYLRKPHAIGKPVPVADVRVTGADGRPAAAGTPGELWVRGPMLMVGYWRDEEATNEVIRNGWFATGDVVVRDGDGDLTIVDRAKDVVIRGGENVYSVEVEHVLDAHPLVVESAIVGIPHPDLGEAVKAVVVARGPVTDRELQAWCAARLASYKVPARFEFRTEPLPRNAAGKILKAELRETA